MGSLHPSGAFVLAVLATGCVDVLLLGSARQAPPPSASGQLVVGGGVGTQAAAPPPSAGGEVTVVEGGTTGAAPAPPPPAVVAQPSAAPPPPVVAQPSAAPPPPVVVAQPSAAPPPPVVVAPTTSVAQGSGVIGLALGENHTCSLAATGQVRCWGYNQRGELGVGTSQSPADGFVTGIGDASDGPVRAIAAGGYQTCALTSAGRVWCWGSNHAGQVGSGAASDAPVRTPTLVRGLGDVATLALGDATSCAITRQGELFCWGANDQRQIDDSSRRALPSPTRVPGFDRVEQVAVGNYHLCVLRGGRVACRGELAALAGSLASLDQVTSVSAGWGHSCAVRAGAAYCWGKTYLGVLGQGRSCPSPGGCGPDALLPPTPVPGVQGAVRIEGHDYHTCVRTQVGSVVCWGNNQGHSFAADLPAEPSQTARLVAGFEHVDSVFVGGAHVCALRDGVAACRGNDWAGAVRGARGF